MKKNNWITNLIIYVGIILVVGGIIFGYVSVNYPDFVSSATNTTITDVNGVVVENKGFSKGTVTLIFLIFILSSLLMVAYLLFKSKKGGSVIEHPKSMVSPDRAVELFIEWFCLNKGIVCKYNNDKGLYVPGDESFISENDRVPYFDSLTGDNFLFIEIIVTKGSMMGTHSVILPLDKGEEIIKNGYARIDTNTVRFEWSKKPRTFPQSSLADKKDRLNMFLVDSSKNDDSNNEVMKKMLEQQEHQQQEQQINNPEFQGSDVEDENVGNIDNNNIRYNYRRKPAYKRYRR